MESFIGRPRKQKQMSEAHNNATSETLAGGAVRVSFGAPAPEVAVNVGPSTRVHNGAVRWTAGGEAEQHGGVAKHTVSHDGVDGGGVLQTRQRINGRDSVLMTPGDPTSRIELRMAVKMGLLTETAPGVYADAKTADGAQKTLETVQAEQQQLQKQQAQEQAGEQAAALEGVFSGEEDAAFAADMQAVPEHAFRAAMASGVKAMVLGQDLTEAAARLSQETGMDPSLAAEKVDDVVWYFESIVSRAVEKVGVGEADRVAFFEDCRGNPGRLQNAVYMLMHGRDPGPFMQMGQEWALRNKRTGGNDSAAPAAPVMSEANLRAAGFETSTSRQGVLMVKAGANGKWVPAGELVRG